MRVSVIVTLALLVESMVCFPHMGYKFLTPPNPKTPETTRSWLQRRQEGPIAETAYKKIDVTGIHAWQAPGLKDK